MMGRSINSQGWSTIAFGMGSVLVLAELFVGVIVKENPVLDHITHPFEWSLLGYIGLILWTGAVGAALWIRTRGGGSRRKDNTVFLRGQKRFKCRECGRLMDASRVGYHRRMVCKCGADHDVFQDMPWDETYSQKEKL